MRQMKLFKKREKLKRYQTYYVLAILLVLVFALGILIFVFQFDEDGVFLQPPNIVIISSCGNLDLDNTYYILNQSILNFDPGPSMENTCFNLTGNNLILDGGSQHIISSLGGGTAVFLDGVSNISIRNLNITLFSFGISLGNSNNIDVMGNDFFTNTNGVFADGPSNVLVSLNLITDSGLYGVFFTSSSEINVSENSVTNSNSDSIFMKDSNDIIVSDNYVNGSGSAGLSFQNVVTSSIFRNTVENTDFGINGYGLNDSFITQNGMHNNQYGMLIRNSENNYMIQNYIFDSSIRDLLYDVGSVNLIENFLSSYDFVDLSAGFVREGVSKIHFKELITQIGSNLTEDIKIGFNYAYINSSKSGLNKSANITFYGLPNFINATIYRDGVFCDVSICTNYTGLNDHPVEFGVTGWSNYSMGEGTYESLILTIAKPSNNSEFSEDDFPIDFNVSLSREGDVKFSLDEGITNTSLASSNNLNFIYSQSSLSSGTYDLILYANSSDGVKAEKSITFRVITRPAMNIDEPDEDKTYEIDDFPVTFEVDLNLPGSVNFSLNNGRNITMNTTDDLTFTYEQSSLSIGNYTFKANALFNNGTKLSDSVDFFVDNSTSSGNNNSGNNGQGNNNPGGGNNNNSNNNSNNTNPGGTTINLNNTEGEIEGGSTSGVETRNIIYWIIISILIVSAIILAILIVKHMKKRSLDKVLGKSNYPPLPQHYLR